MATIKPPLVVCDAGPLIHLDELDSLGLLHSMGSLLLPREVWVEVQRHRPRLALHHIPDTQVHEVDATSASIKLAALCDSLDLDSGERAALALMETASANMLLCDDAAARLAAESLGFAVRGTIGILVRSTRVGLRSRREVYEILKQLPLKSSLHVSRQLLARVIEEVDRS